tara:strand:+ start:45 stop:737 length:693 start_codon:yes stop_codon:yes gene_type:complete
MVNNLSLLSTLFEYPENYPALFESNARKYFNGSDIHVLRYKKEIEGSRYDKLYYYKVPKLLEYLKSCTTLKEYILFLDATDTNFYKDPTNMVDDFLKYECKALFCGDPHIWPKTEATNLYDIKPKLSRYCYLNSGSYIGYTDYIIACLEKLTHDRPYDSIDDQGNWTYLYIHDHNEEIKVDQDRSIFFSTLEAKADITQENDRFIVKQSPYIVHDNGPSTPDTIKIAKEL